MFSCKKVIGILVVICINHFQNSHGVVEVVTKSQTFEDGIFLENEQSFNDGSFVYAICESNASNLTNCKVVQENYPYDDVAYSCVVSLENNYANHGVDVLITALGKDKAVLSWCYKESEDYSTIVHIGTMDFITCNMTRVAVPDAMFFTYMHLSSGKKLVAYKDDSFDVFYSDPKRHPEDGDLYKIQIDANGKMIAEPKSTKVERGFYFYVSTVANRSPAKGYVFVKRNQYRSRQEFSQIPVFHLLLVRPNGTAKHLAEYKGNALGDAASGNNFISLCYKSEDKIHIVCTQYDEYGNVMFITTLATKNDATDVIKSYNLPNGGMLIMYGATKYDPQKGIHKKNGFEVVWIGLDGKEKGRMHIQKSEIPNGMVGTPYIYAKENNVYCATVVIKDKYSNEAAAGKIPVNLKIVANCFTTNDLRT